MDDAAATVRAGLERIEAVWRDRGVPIVDVLAQAPGPGQGRVCLVPGAIGWWGEPGPEGRPPEVPLARFTLWWAEAFESDAYRFDRDEGAWDADNARLPLERASSM